MDPDFGIPELGDQFFLPKFLGQLTGHPIHVIEFCLANFDKIKRLRIIENGRFESIIFVRNFGFFVNVNKCPFPITVRAIPMYELDYESVACSIASAIFNLNDSI